MIPCYGQDAQRKSPRRGARPSEDTGVPRAVVEVAPLSTSTELQLGLGLGLWARRWSPTAADPGKGGTSLSSMWKCLAPEASVQDPGRSRRNPQALSPHSCQSGVTWLMRTALISPCSHGNGEVRSTFLLKDDPVTYTKNNFNGNTEVKCLK